MCGRNDRFFCEHPLLAKAAIGRVAIMGGVQVKDGVLVPNDAYNHTVDRELNPNPAVDPIGPSAKSLYALLQREGYDVTVLGRFAVYAAHLDPAYYDLLAKTGHPLALRLLRDQRDAFENL